MSKEEMEQQEFDTEEKLSEQDALVEQAMEFEIEADVEKSDLTDGPDPEFLKDENLVVCSEVMVGQIEKGQVFEYNGSKYKLSENGRSGGGQVAVVNVDTNEEERIRATNRCSLV